MTIYRNDEAYGGSFNIAGAKELIHEAVLRDRMRGEYAYYTIMDSATGEIVYEFDPAKHIRYRIKLYHVVAGCMVSCVLLYAFELFMRYGG